PLRARRVPRARGEGAVSGIIRCARSRVSSSSLRANGSRECAPDDRLREAIHAAARGELDCFVAVAPRNDGKKPAGGGLHLTPTLRRSFTGQPSILRLQSRFIFGNERADLI